MFMYLLLRSWKIISKIVNIMKLPIWKQEDLVGTLSLTWVQEVKYKHLKHEELKENFFLIILGNMSTLNQLPSSRNNYLNHVIDWEKVFDQCKTHQNNYSDKDSKQVLSRFSFIWHSDLFFKMDWLLSMQAFWQSFKLLKQRMRPAEY